MEEPYNIYAEGTPTEKAQAYQSDLLKRIKNKSGEIADSTIGKATLTAVDPLPMAARDLATSTGNLLDNVQNRFSVDHARNQDVVAHGKTSNVDNPQELLRRGLAPPLADMSSDRQTLNSSASPFSLKTPASDAMQAVYANKPNGDQSFIPVQQPQNIVQPEKRAEINAMQPGSGWIRDESTGNVVSLDGGSPGQQGNISWRNSQGQSIARTPIIPNPTNTRTPISDVSQQGLPTGVQRLNDNSFVTAPPQMAPGQKQSGGMNVTFDDSVTPEQRAAFLQTPTRASEQAGIDRFRSRVDAAVPIPVPNPLDGLINPDSAPGMRRGDVAELNRQIIANRGSAASNATSVQTTGMNNDTSLQTAKMSNNTATDRNNIDRFRAQGESSVQSAQAKNIGNEATIKQYDIDRQEQLKDISAKISDPNTNPKDLRSLQEYYRVLSLKPQDKFQITRLKGVDEKTGMPTERAFAVNPNDPGSSVEIGGTTGGLKGSYADAVTLLNANKKDPNYINAFKERYGSLPPGF